jgi:Domain of unknown function (DUF4893)
MTAENAMSRILPSALALLIAMLIGSAGTVAQAQPSSPPGPSGPPRTDPVPAPPWMAPLNEYDRGRIDRIDQTRAMALEKIAGSDRAKLRIVFDLLYEGAKPIDIKGPDGNWRCRSLKLAGKFVPVDVAPFFSCRFSISGGVLLFEKTTGSIRRMARFAPIDELHLLYYGAYYAERDKPRSYGAGEPYDEVGVLARAGRNRLRLEMPEPYAYAEALYEVLELVR